MVTLIADRQRDVVRFHAPAPLTERELPTSQLNPFWRTNNFFQRTNAFKDSGAGSFSTIWLGGGFPAVCSGCVQSSMYEQGPTLRRRAKAAAHVESNCAAPARSRKPWIGSTWAIKPCTIRTLWPMQGFWRGGSPCSRYQRCWSHMHLLCGPIPCYSG